MISLWIPESIIPIDDGVFLEICRKNPDNRIERTQKGEIVFMAPTGGETGKFNALIIGIFYIWNKIQKKGKIFDSSTAFRLPSTAIRSPDLAFISTDRWNSLSKGEKESFPPICPDFVLEIRSKTDKLTDLQSKMEEWIEGGCKLGWLLDIENLQFFIYKPESEDQVLQGTNVILTGEDVLPEFTLSIEELINQ
jgi:Uma2 family endonuclease